MKFTFKTEKPIGPYSVFYPKHHYVKLKKQKIGFISDINPYRISLKVIKADIMEDKNSNCSWKWITLKKESKSINEAKEFLNTNFDSLTKKYNLAMESEESK